MEYSSEFKKFVSDCNLNRFYVGIGNPNARILFIGKEPALPEGDVEYENNAKEWQEHINNETCHKLEYLVDEKHVLRKSWGCNTWSKYQKLKDHVFNSVERKNYVDFLRDVFTTEMNDTTNLRTLTADKSSLNAKKELFRDSKFIQRFPVIVLACSNYIHNNDEIREIDDIFGVTYDGDNKGKYCYNKNNWFFTHHSLSYDKLVIHTRQLSADVVDEMLRDMAKVINKHLGI